jgi:hypothetical protein
MADEKKSEVVSIRLDTEDRERLKAFVEEEGKNNKDFMSLLLNLYELNKAKIKNVNLVGDIEQLEQQTAKINQIFINIVDKLEGQKASILENGAKELDIYKDKVYKLQEDNTSLKLDNETTNKMYTDVYNVNTSLKQQIE